MLPEDRVVSTGKENPEAQLILSEHPVARTSIPKHPNLTRFRSYIWDNIFLRNLSNIYQITRCHILTDSTLQWHHSENVISCISRVFVGGGVSVSNEILQICYLTRDRALSCYCVLLIRRIRHIITYCLLWMYVWHCLLLHNLTCMKFSFIHSICYFCVTP